MEEDADPGEALKFSAERLEPEPHTEGEGNVLDTNVKDSTDAKDHTDAKDRRAEKPARPKRRNPRLPSDNQYIPHNPRHSE